MMTTTRAQLRRLVGVLALLTAMCTIVSPVAAADGPPETTPPAGQHDSSETEVSGTEVSNTNTEVGSSTETSSDSDHDHTDTDHDHTDSDHGGEPDRLECADLDPTWLQLQVSGHPVSGNHVVGDDTITVEIVLRDAPAGGKVVNWHASAPIDAVMLRSGQDHAVYEYDPPVTGASGLLPPLKDRDGRNLAAVIACYDPDRPLVGVELTLEDDADPIEVGDTLTYHLAVHAAIEVASPEVTVTLSELLGEPEAGECVVDGVLVSCTPTFVDGGWSTTLEAVALEAGDAITFTVLEAEGDGGLITLSSVEVTRIIGAPGGGGCGGHDDGHDTDGHETDGHEPGGGTDDTDGCGGGQAGALVAACTELDPDWTAVLLMGPYGNRSYVVGEAGGRIWVEVSESPGHQVASWTSEAPVGAVLARTGQNVISTVFASPMLEGSGVTGAPSGSGAPRPIADMVFCVAPEISTTAPGPIVLPPLIVPVPDTTADLVETLVEPPVERPVEVESGSEVLGIEVVAILPETGPQDPVSIAALAMLLIVCGAALVLATPEQPTDPNRW
jgi:hypothetical protein